MDPLLAISLALLLGMTLGPDWPIAPWTVVLLVAVTGLSWTSVLARVRRPLILLCVVALGAFLAARAVPPPIAAQKRMSIHGVVRDVAILPDRTRLVIEAPRPPWPPDVVVILPAGTTAEIGDVRRITGSFLPPQDGSAVLSSAARGSRGTMVDATIEPADVVGSAGVLVRLRRVIAERLSDLHPGDRGALLSGLLTGTRASLSARAQEDLRGSGLAHIIAISGANFVLVVDLLRRLVGGLSRRLRPIALAGGTIVFWAFVDGGMAVARAALSTLIGLTADAVGRRADAGRTLSITAAILALWVPLAPRADASLQLSALATAAVLVAGRIGSRDPGIFEWRTTLRTSVATTLATFPIQLTTFGALPLVAPLANVLALPLVPIAMATGALEVLVADIPGIGLVLHGLVSLTSGAILFIASATSSLPGARLALPALPAWTHGLVIALGGAIAFWLVLRRHAQPKQPV